MTTLRAAFLRTHELREFSERVPSASSLRARRDGTQIALRSFMAQMHIRTRTTFSGSGERAVGESVYCPRRGQSVALPVCATCPVGGERHGGKQECNDPSARAQHSEPRCAADEVLASDIMQTQPLCVRPDLSIDGLSMLFLEHNISGAPVVDEAGRPLGIVSKTDLVRFQVDHQDGASGELTRTSEGVARVLDMSSATVGDVMMPIAFTLSEHATVAHAAAMMALEDVHRVPIVAIDGKVVGIISSMDVTRWVAVNEGYLADTAMLAAKR